METWSEQSPTSSQPPPGEAEEAALAEGAHERRSMLQRIGWRRPSPDEQRLWFIQGAVILAAVLVIGTLMLLALR